MAISAFRWALRKLNEVGLVVCCEGTKYFIKAKKEGFIDLSRNPEVKSLLKSQQTNASEIISLAQKLTGFTH